MTQRIQRHPYLSLFDGPDTNHSTDVRTSATVPLQALYLMNNPFVTEQAQAFATRVMDEAADASVRLDRACEIAWGRPPTDGERASMLEFLEQAERELTRWEAPAPSREHEAWTALARVVLTANELVYID
ncbi:MAG: DUF1553 domain-containing protein, partial [Planctomycetaceae bacterium]|nr:DUF1553 domain-containing protein [Planctomycetaceae bacterium]